MWWEKLEVLQQVTFVIGSITALFMVLQIVLMLIGLGGDDTFEGGGYDGDADIFNDEGIISGLKVVSLRSIVALICVGSWTTYTLVFLLPQWAACLLGLVAGTGAGFLVALIINAFTKLQADPSLVIENCVGKNAEVYLTVPPSRSGQGKVNVYVQEAIREFEAVSDHTEAIKTGSQAKVVGVVSQGLLLVAPYTP